MKKKVIAIVSILLLIIVAVTMAMVFKTKQAEKNEKEEKAKETTNAVPVMRVLYGEEVVGKIEGYTMDMNESRMRDVLIPVAENHRVPLKITVNDNQIESISYELKELKEDKLIDNGEIKNWKSSEAVSYTHLTLPTN